MPTPRRAGRNQTQRAPGWLKRRGRLAQPLGLLRCRTPLSTGVTPEGLAARALRCPPDVGKDGFAVCGRDKRLPLAVLLHRIEPHRSLLLLAGVAARPLWPHVRCRWRCGLPHWLLHRNSSTRLPPRVHAEAENCGRGVQRQHGLAGCRAGACAGAALFQQLLVHAVLPAVPPVAPHRLGHGSGGVHLAAPSAYIPHQ